MAPVESNDDYYAVLEISNSATLEVVNQNFKRLAKIRNPDKLREGGSTAAFQLASLIHLFQFNCHTQGQQLTSS